MLTNAISQNPNPPTFGMQFKKISPKVMKGGLDSFYDNCFWSEQDYYTKSIDDLNSAIGKFNQNHKHDNIPGKAMIKKIVCENFNPHRICNNLILTVKHAFNKPPIEVKIPFVTSGSWAEGKYLKSLETVQTEIVKAKNKNSLNNTLQLA